ncbi:PfkB family carbohydrate kinase [Streptomyces sp. V3I7]|uniref:PfkB family carbohydrate kinase n=1 Tax=Streptomyces sp. V3I7 TaxID=3042278 RepID=UPI002782B4E2|nr:PfkB family carbohydrate kinase [Streptomyces sp. V3I7]MDQ0988946.1 sugar/nucleoside kinase (ribokinase family) [Streptomyces sp. V3I7]
MRPVAEERPQGFQGSQGPRGLFVGLCTLDVIQLVDHVPEYDEKLTAHDQVVAAGGPAANAAAVFSALGGRATLLTGIGRHPLGLSARADLEGLGVTVTDLAAGVTEPPAVSSILVTAATGRRAVASTNAGRHQLAPPDGLDALVAACDIVELDGHHRELALATAELARAIGRPTLLDGGSWKDGTDKLLPAVDVAVCSADFHPPGTRTPEDVLTYLHDRGVTWAAVSRGGEPLLWSGPGGKGVVDVPPTKVVDTLGAGDALHGAFAHHWARAPRADTAAFTAALARATEVASRSCAEFGTRAWLPSRSLRNS